MLSPLQVITVPCCDNKSSVDSLFHEDESIVQEEKHEDKEIYKLKWRKILKAQYLSKIKIKKGPHQEYSRIKLSLTTARMGRL